MNVFENREARLFNTPLEVGLRSLFILKSTYPKSIDLQRLVYYDYLMLHSGDIEAGPKSLHPSLPQRAAEITVKRDIISRGLMLMKSKELVSVSFDATGIGYKATKLTTPFLQFLSHPYSKSLDTLADWVVTKFSNFSDENLDTFVSNNLSVWGSEFENESLIRGFYDE